MRTLQVHVRASLPQALEPLWEIARNVWWSWNPDAIALFRRINPEDYEASGPCALRLLNRVSAEVWKELASDNSFLEHLNSVWTHLQNYLETGLTSVEGLHQDDTSRCCIGYFSMEFGLHESIPLYSGGLGILAGDHLKTASDLSLPLVGVGLFYNEGYFRQKINHEGWQTEFYDFNDPFYMPMSRVEDRSGNPLTISVKIENQDVYAQIWRIDVGRVPLYLLDTDLPLNQAEQRRITSRLYAGGEDLRIPQEMILGIGGVRALQAMGIQPTVFHLNEGHSAFLTLERVAQKVGMGMSWREALLSVKGSQVFTIHTPVPAGNDSFSLSKVQKFMGDIDSIYKMPANEFYKIGQTFEQPELFSMPVFALRTSGQRNGVSKLHQAVSQKIWKHLWPYLSEQEIPISGVTNGVHTGTWICSELAVLLDRYLGKGWEKRVEDEKMWARVELIPDSEIWDMHLLRKSRLMTSVFKSLAETKRKASHGIGELKQILRPEVLTLGFARRFASYKRGHLMFRDIQRLKRLILNEERPVQIFIAGKSHPADGQGKEIIKRVIDAIESEKLGSRILFLEDYDMSLAQRLVRGVDVWINTPIRPLEASGTSGMKVALNGGLNFSILDGWWDEGFDGENGWAIGDRDEFSDENARDEHDAQDFYEILEHEIIPMYYASTVPANWIQKMKRSMMTLAPQFSAQRMVLDYVKGSYIPAQRFHENYSGTLEKQRNTLHDLTSRIHELQNNWSGVGILQVDVKPKHSVTVGEKLHIEVEITAPFSESWLEVSLQTATTHTHSSPQGNPVLACVCLHFSHKKDTGLYVFMCDLDTTLAGVRSYTVRVTPNQSLFPHQLDLNLVTRW
jgi:starch phosphorylase